MKDGFQISRKRLATDRKHMTLGDSMTVIPALQMHTQKKET